MIQKLWLPSNHARLDHHTPSQDPDLISHIRSHKKQNDCLHHFNSPGRSLKALHNLSGQLAEVLERIGQQKANLAAAEMGCGIFPNP
jgi:hypothetical protein